MNFEAVKAIYLFEMARTRRTLLQSVVSPVISTSLYFIVFGAAGERFRIHPFLQHQPVAEVHAVDSLIDA